MKKLMENFKNLMKELVKEPEPFSNMRTYNSDAFEKDYRAKFCSLSIGK